MRKLAKHLLTQWDIHSQKRPFLVAIDGLGGAGKTTLVKTLKAELKTQCLVHVLHIDDHIVERNKRYDTGYEEWYEYYYLQWNIEKMKCFFTKVHHEPTELSLPVYNTTTDSIILKQLPLEPNSMLLIEGVFLQRTAWRSFYDFIVFVDCKEETRHQRVLNRDRYIGDYEDRLHKYKRRYWPAEAYYMKTVEPIEKAHIVHHCASPNKMV